MNVTQFADSSGVIVSSYEPIVRTTLAFCTSSLHNNFPEDMMVSFELLHYNSKIEGNKLTVDNSELSENSSALDVLFPADSTLDVVYTPSSEEDPEKVRFVVKYLG